MKRTVLLIMATFLCCFLLCLASNVTAQDACEGNFDCDQDVDGTDAAVFKEDFGRSAFKNPCPDCTSSCDPAAPVPKTGQKTSFQPGDDGHLEKGVAWPNPRFTDNGNGTVTDNLTGLIWLKNAECFGGRTWSQAITDANFLASGSCGLTDGSNDHDWRLPNRKELFSLIDDNYWSPAVPNTVGTGQWTEGDPFVNVETGNYWTSTHLSDLPGYAWFVQMYNGIVYLADKTEVHLVWPVRGGQGCITGETRPCGTDIGECEYGVETCTDGIWGECIWGEPMPDNTPCNGGDVNFCNSTCQSGTCSATPVDCSAVNVIGDCQDPACNISNGNCSPTGLVNNADTPFDGNECTEDICNNGIPSNPFMTNGTPCSGGTCIDGVCVP